MKMQQVKFSSVEEMLDFLPEDELLITEHLRNIVLNSIPRVTERLSYNVPFYKRNKGLCFIWPGAVYWGSKRTYQGVRFGFNQGHLLADPEQILLKGDRKQVYYLDFLSIDEIDEGTLKSFLYDAVAIDDSL